MQAEIILDTYIFLQYLYADYFSLVTQMIFYMIAYFYCVKYMAGALSVDLHERNLTARY